MNDRQENLLNMYRTVIAVCTANVDYYGSQSAFGSMVTILQSHVNTIQESRQFQERETKGITLDKNKLKDDLVFEAAAIAAVISSYASKASQLDLRETVHFSERELSKMRVEALISACRIILEKVNEHKTALAPYGITAARITSLQARINAFDEAAPGSSAARSERKKATQNLELLFDDVNKLLTEQMDSGVKIYKLQSPEFYRVYTAARKVIPAGKRIETKGSMGGTVKAKLTGLPLQGVSIVVYNTSLNAASDGQGKYHIAAIPSGVYTIEASKQGYKTYRAPDKPIVANQELTLNIEMELV